MVVVFQRIAKFIPLIMASSSARLICWESLSGRNQQTSSTTAPSYTSNMLASTFTLRAWPSTHHLPCAGSSLCTLVRMSLIMVLRGASSILSSYPVIGAHLLEGMPCKGLTLLTIILSTFQCIRPHEPEMDPCDHLTPDSRALALLFVYSAEWLPSMGSGPSGGPIYLLGKGTDHPLSIQFYSSCRWALAVVVTNLHIGGT